MLTLPVRVGAAHIDFIVDTRASLSIIPVSMVNGINLSPTPVRISSATGQNIKCHGEAVIEVGIPHLHRNFSWNFVIAETTHALLGFDFLTKYELMVDCKNKKLIDPLTSRFSVLNISRDKIMSLNINSFVDLSDRVRNIVNEYPELIKPRQPPKSISNSCKTYHFIDTQDWQPVFGKRRQLSNDKLVAAKSEFKQLLDQGIVRYSKSPWSSPLHMVAKGDSGGWRICGDYRNLNNITKPDRYPIPHMHDVSSKLHGKTTYSKLDLLSAFNQLPVNPADIEKTAVVTPFGSFEWLFMPFGLRNASSTFQRYMDNLFMDMECVFVYIDDILVFSENEEQHEKDLRKVFEVLRNNHLRISVGKCLFFKSQLDFLGFTIGEQGMKPSANKLYTMKNFPQPNNSASLRSFLGLMNYYRHLIPNFANVVLPLTELARLNPNSKTLILSKVEVDSFAKIVDLLDNMVALSHPVPGVMNLQMVTDSSQYAVGGALHQIIDNNPVPISFFSKKLSQTQRAYSTYDRELLAAYLSVLHFKHLIEGRAVTLFTDHKPLQSAFKSPKPAKSDRQQRQLSVMAEYILDVQYIKGEDNCVADCLSRPACAVTIDVCDLPAIAEHQVNDDEMFKFKQNLSKFPLPNNKEIFCDVSNIFPRPYVPAQCRSDIIRSLHDISHPGVKSTAKLVKERFFWPSMDTSIKKFVSECIRCQRAKVNKHTKSAVSNFNLPSERFQTVHIDLVGPLCPAKLPGETYTNPARYILTCVDRCTRWVEVATLSEITASTVALGFLNTWISRFGVPLHLVTDRGAQFESELFMELSSLIGFHRLRTTSYHPQCNGMIERFHRTLKTAIKARGESWFCLLYTSPSPRDKRQSRMPSSA